MQGLERNIGKNQARAACIALAGTHEDRIHIQKTGKQNAWCKGSIDWEQDKGSKL